MSPNIKNELIIKDEGAQDKWTFITPILGVRLTNDIKNELKIKRVHIVSKNRLARIRKNLGISMKISDLKKLEFGEIFEGILKLADTYAIVRHSGNVDKVIKDCRKIVQDELAILSCSQLGWTKRRFNHSITMKINKSKASFHHLLVNTDNRKHFIAEIASKIGDLKLNGEWKSFCKYNYFTNLLKLINKKSNVANAWREDVERAAILIGQSQESDEIAHAFLWNMIALELLLTEQGDKYTDVLPQRISAFLGWFDNWEVGKYSDRINDIYRKRCAFVHDGRKENITVEDLLFTDDILFNIVTNLLAHTKLIKSKADVILFSKKVEAEKPLGVKPKIRPKSLMLISRTYTEKDFERI